MDDRQRYVGHPGIAPLCNGKVGVASLAEAGIATPVVGTDLRARRNGAFDKVTERVGAAIGHDSEPNTPRVTAALALVELGAWFALADLDSAGGFPIQKFLSTLHVNFQRPSAEAFDGGQNVVGGLGPTQRLGVGVLVCKEGLDGPNQLFDRLVGAALDLLLGKQREEALDLVNPGRRGWREVLMPTGPLGEPVADRLRLVARGVVHDDVHVKAERNVALDLVEELAELLRPVAGHALAYHRAGLHVGLGRHGCYEAGEQRRGAMALIIVRAPLDLAGAHRQQRLGAIERLDLTLLVNADDERLVGWIEVKADDIANLFNELWIGRELERLRSMRLQREGAPDSMHGGSRDARRLRHVARAPVGGTLRFLLQRLDDDGFDLIVTDLAGCAASGLVVEAIEPMLDEALAPGAHGLARGAHGIRNLTVVHPLGRAENDLSPRGVALRDLAAPDAALEKVPLVRVEYNGTRLGRSPRRHARLRIIHEATESQRHQDG
jgi:hypothetical protein